MSIDRRSLVQMTTRRGFIAAGALATYSLIPVKSSLAVNPCANGNPLEPILDAAADAFNKASLSGTIDDWNTYAAFLDDHVTLFKMSGGPPIVGKPAVMSALENGDHDQISFITKCNFNTATSTRAIGKAYWQDDTNGCNFAAGTCPTINFLFDFTSASKIITMIGTRDHPSSPQHP
jgi:hypothetical protein